MGKSEKNTKNLRFSRRRSKIQRDKRPQSDFLNDAGFDVKNEYKQKRKRNRSKSRDNLNHDRSDHVVLDYSPSNSLVMTENVLFKYQKDTKQRYATKTTTKQRYHRYPNKKNRANTISIERISYSMNHGNGSPSDSISK